MIPEYWVRTYDLLTKGLVEEAQEMQRRYVGLEHAVVGKYGFTETIKAA